MKGHLAPLTGKASSSTYIYETLECYQYTAIGHDHVIHGRLTRKQKDHNDNTLRYSTMKLLSMNSQSPWNIFNSTPSYPPSVGGSENKKLRPRKLLWPLCLA